MTLTELVDSLVCSYSQEEVMLKHVEYGPDLPVFKKAPKYLFRGERDFYPETLSSKDRLVSLTTEQMVEFLDCASTFVAELAIDVIRPLPQIGSPDRKSMLNEVHSWVQHYGVPVMSVDLTADLHVAAFFASSENTSGRGRIGIVETRKLIDGHQLLQMDRGFCPRARNQRGYALRMWDEQPDLKDTTVYPVKWYEFEMRPSDHVFAERADLMAPTDDWLLDHVLVHLRRIRATDRGVQELFDSIRLKLKDPVVFSGSEQTLKRP